MAHLVQGVAARGEPKEILEKEDPKVIRVYQEIIVVSNETASRGLKQEKVIRKKMTKTFLCLCRAHDAVKQAKNDFRLTGKGARSPSLLSSSLRL